MPNPTEAKNPHQFREKLKELKSWAGDPSLKRMQALSGRHPDDPGRPALSRSTASEILNLTENDPRLPNDVSVSGFVRACMIHWQSRTAKPAATDAGDRVAKEVEQWVTVLRGLRAAEVTALDGESSHSRTKSIRRHKTLIKWISRHKILVGILGTGLLTVLVFGGIGMVGGNDSEATSPSATGSRPADGPVASSAPAPTCDTYEVRARDLWLRDEYGGPLKDQAHGELVQGQLVTLLRGPNSLGHVEVKAADGREGWVDRRYLKPAC